MVFVIGKDNMREHIRTVVMAVPHTALTPKGPSVATYIIITLLTLPAWQLRYE